MSERLIWLKSAVLDRLKAMRWPGESYSDVILRLVEIEPSTGYLKGS
jgi:predicted CopG family antitoxin